MDCVTRLFQLSSLLLRLPILTKDLAHSFLVEFKFSLELIHPHYLVDNLGDVSGLVEGLIHSVLVE